MFDAEDSKYLVLKSHYIMWLAIKTDIVILSELFGFFFYFLRYFSQVKFKYHAMILVKRR